MSRRAVIRYLLAVTALAVAVPAPALAADEASIAHVESRNGDLRLLVSVPPDARVDLSGVTLTVDGVATPARAELAGSAGSVRRVAVLAVDTSDSMRGPRFSAAQDAAAAFLRSVPPDVEVGIVSFAADVEPVLAPTTDRAEAVAVVESLSLSRRTRLYDGVLSALEMAGDAGLRTVLVLSDGADTSDTSLRTVTASARDSGALVDVVALDQDGPAEAALQRLARAGRGRVVDAEPEALTAAFSAEAAVLARQVMVTATAPDEGDKREGTVSVTLPVKGSGAALEAQALARFGQPERSEEVAPTVPAPDRGLVLAQWWLWAGLLALGVALAVLLVLLLPRSSRDLSPAERTSSYLARVGTGGRAAASAVAGSDPGQRFEPEHALEQAKVAARRVLSHNRGLESRIARRLEAAGNPLRPAEWLLLHVSVFVAAGVLGLLLGAGSPILVLLFLALGAAGPFVWLGVARSRRRRAFNAALPETLQLMAGSLSAGLSLAQSVDTIVREGVQPVADEFRRVLVETRLGVALEDALEGVAHRFESRDFAWAVMAIRIQRQVGGNLAELLDTVAATMREREYVRRQVSALAAEGKLSAWVLGGLPPLFLLYLMLTSGDYVMVLFTDPRGWVMLGGAVLLLSAGVFWMSRLVKVEV